MVVTIKGANEAGFKVLLLVYMRLNREDSAMAKNQSLCVLFAVLSSLVVNGCSDHSLSSAASLQPRPVAVLRLSELDFRHASKLTGSVGLYRQEQVGFEVSGRVLSVLDLGIEVNGPALDEQGVLVKRGDFVAAVDDTRYRLQFERLQARLDSEKRNLDAISAELDRALKTFNRQKRIFEKGAGNQQAVDDATSAYKSLAARQGQQKARIKEIGEQLNKAREDLEDCILYAPFSGRITRVHVTQGAVVEAAAPVVTLTLMDPIQVQVAVSADHDRRIQTGDRAFLYPEDPIMSNAKALEVPALVFEKGATADPDTHTFRIDLMARNRRLMVDDFAPETAGLPQVNEFLPAVRRYQGEAGPLFVPVASIYRSQGKAHVLRLPGVGFRVDARRDAVGRHIPEKIEIELDDDYFTVVKWTFRSLKHSADLREGDFLVIDPQPVHESGLAIGRPQWLFRPGDLVPVRFLLDATPRGFYVPVDAITTIAGKHSVFVVEDGVARLRTVSVHESYQELRRIEGEGITTDTAVITGGMHYVSDGEPVRIVAQSGGLS